MVSEPLVLNMTSAAQEKEGDEIVSMKKMIDNMDSFTIHVVHPWIPQVSISHLSMQIAHG